MCSLDIWKPVHALFRDDDHFHHVLSKYPKHYLEVSDEAVEYAKDAMYNIQDILSKITYFKYWLEGAQNMNVALDHELFVHQCRSQKHGCSFCELSYLSVQHQDSSSATLGELHATTKGRRRKPVYLTRANTC